MKKKVYFIIFLLLVLIASISTITKAITITGKVSAQATNVSIFIMPAELPTLTITSPENKTYIINTSLLLNYTATNEDKVWYNLDNLENTTITSFVYFNTSQGSHTLYLYANNTDGNITSRNITFIANSTKFRILYEEYKGNYKGSSNDFNSSPYEDMQNMSNIILEHASLGKILFNQIINLTDDENPNDNTLDLDSYTNISSNRIELNSTALPNFNKQATLWLYNLAYSNPRILKDGSVCPSTICTKESYSSNMLKFNVTGFSIYSAEETPTEAPPGGGGGGGTANIIKQFSLDKEKIQITLKQGETKKETITIKNTGNQKIKITLDTKLEEFMKISETSFDLNAGEAKIIILDFIVREDTNPDLYIGKLNIKAEGLQKEILIAIEVESKKPLFDVKVEIPKRFQTIMPGEEIMANIKLYSLGKTGRVDVSVEYKIKDKEGKEIISEHETIAVETQTSFVKELKIPENANFGTYMLYVKAVYDHETASSSAWFIVGKKPFFTKENIILIITVVIILIFILIILIELRKIRKHMKAYMKIDENILVKEKLIKTKGGK